MGTALTPGLTVSPHARVQKDRRLPIKGEVLVDVGAEVVPGDVVARALLPGPLYTLKLPERLAIEPFEVGQALKVEEGDSVKKGQVVAQQTSFFGLFTSTVEAPVDGTVEFFTTVTGHLGIRAAPAPVEVRAYIKGTVTAIFPEEGVTICAAGAFIQGIFGVGGEQQGRLLMVARDAEDSTTAVDLPADVKGRILVCGKVVSLDALQQAAAGGAVGIISGGIVNEDLAGFLGYDIGVAVTGHEDIPLSIITTEGFGPMVTAARTFELLKALEGRDASINGATQIRAGAVRPEIFVHGGVDGTAAVDGAGGAAMQALEIGTTIRIVRVPYFGSIGKVTDLPTELTRLESGSLVRILEAELSDGQRVRVPRANVEIVAG